ncbi:MAG: WD40 repeat domain-containing protein [Gemmataceae bacterium]
MNRPQPRLTRRWDVSIPDHVIALGWSPTGRWLAAAAVSGPVIVVDASTGQVARQLTGHGFGTTALSWSPDGNRLATAGQDGLVRLWDPAEGRELATCAGGAAWVEQVLWHPTRDVFASAAGKKLRLWSGDGQPLRALADQASTIADLAWRPRSAELAVAAYGGVTRWSLETESDQPIAHLAWKGSILKLAWSPDGKQLAHGNQDATVHFWEIATGEELQMAGYPLKVRELCWDPTGTYLATSGADEVTVWDCTPPGPEGSTPLTFPGHTAPVSALAYQAKGLLLASGGEDGRVHLFQPGKFRKSLAVSRLETPIARLAWSPDDRLLAAGTDSGQVVIYTTR